MESAPDQTGPLDSKGPSPTPVERRKKSRRSERTPASYGILDGCTEALLYFMVVFSPWAFGSVQPSAVWTLNVAGYLLGLLLVGKWVIRWKLSFKPARWQEEVSHDETPQSLRRRKWSTGLTVMLAVLTVLVVLYTLISALNARATYDYSQSRFIYNDNALTWLPHSYDANRTWYVFWQYLGLGWTFWALRDWLLGKTRAERHPEPRADDALKDLYSTCPPARLRRLLWVLCVNGALVGIEGILQRLDGSNKLLWLVQPYWNTTADLQFGPFAYRSNAAQYFNLLWPVCLGFWLMLRQAAQHSSLKTNRVGEGPHMLLIPCAIVMAACPLISSSRGGAIVSVINLLLSMFIVLFAIPRRQSWLRWAIAFGLLISLAGGVFLGGRALRERLFSIQQTYLTGLDVGSANFTFRCKILVPPSSPAADSVLLSLSGSRSRLYQPSSMVFTLKTDGTLSICWYGDDNDTHRCQELPGFVQQYATQSAEVVLARSTNLSIYVNGRIVESNEHVRGVPLPSDARLASSYLWVMDRAISQAAIYDKDLGEPQVKELLGDRQKALENDHEDRSAVASWQLDVKPGKFRGLTDKTLGGRDEIYLNARQIAREFPLFGTGPGTFRSVYQLYRPNPTQHWAAYLHNDWLETRTTMGWIGLTLILLSFLAIAIHWPAANGIELSWAVVCFVWLALAGCLVHARFDLPFQVPSLLLLFVIQCAVLFSASRRT